MVTFRAEDLYNMTRRELTKNKVKFDKFQYLFIETKSVSTTRVIHMSELKSLMMRK